MGLIDYKDEEFYYIKNLETKMYLKGFKHSTPIWVVNVEESTAYSEMDALKLQRQLSVQHQKISMIEKK